VHAQSRGSANTLPPSPTALPHDAGVDGHDDELIDIMMPLLYD
jgi:hypothetical protein